MRIAIACHELGSPGGTEVYVRAVIDGLAASGHAVALWREVPRPMAEPARLPVFSSIDCAALERWRPDVIFSQGLWDSEWEERLLALAPGVLLAHTFQGTCISGEKTRKFPRPAPCPRVFGAACLAQYFPRRCGGLSPLTLAARYRRQKSHRVLLDRFAAIVTLSEFMRREIAGHVTDRGRVHHLRFAPPPPTQAQVMSASPAGYADPWHLVYTGRFHDLKGGHLFLRALPLVHERVRRPLRATMIGDGSHRAAWEREAARARRDCSALQIDFRGWMEREAALAITAGASLAIFPSVWPEPFGLAGIEALQIGVPVVGFAVGAVPEWLIDGHNGHLATELSAPGLADALCRALESPLHYQAIRAGALQSAKTLGTVRDHIADLTRVLVAVPAPVRSKSGSALS